MPKQLQVPIDHHRALNRLQTSAGRPHPALSQLDPADWLRTVRLSLHMTQAQLAKRSGVSQQHITLIERGELDPRVTTLMRLFDALFCDLLVLPLPRKRVSAIIAERTTGVPTARMWD